jgi:hypothetical protein
VFGTLELEKVCSVRIVVKQLVQNVPATSLNDTVSAATPNAAAIDSKDDVTSLEADQPSFLELLS